MTNTAAPVSFDADKVMRKKLAADRQRERDRLRKAEERGAKGATPRANSHSRTKPWEQDGVSRSTWERRQKSAAAQARVDDADSSPNQGDEVDANSSTHRLSYSGKTDLRHDAVEQPADSRALEAPGRAVPVVRQQVLECEIFGDGGVAWAPPPTSHLARAIARARVLQADVQ